MNERMADSISDEVIEFATAAGVANVGTEVVRDGNGWQVRVIDENPVTTDQLDQWIVYRTNVPGYETRDGKSFFRLHYEELHDGGIIDKTDPNDVMGRSHSISTVKSAIGALVNHRINSLGHQYIDKGRGFHVRDI
jgi:hypothetical protein